MLRKVSDWVTRVLLLVFTTLFCYQASAQNQSNIWYFGYKCGLNFNDNIPKPDTNHVMSTRTGSATICDTSGNLLFYGSSTQLYNKDHKKMKNGRIYNGSGSSTQGALIVPKGEHQFYVFTTSSNGNGPLSYSIVDMLKDSARGEVIVKDRILLNSSSEKISAIRHANGIDFWVIGHGVNNHSFCVWRTTPKSVVPTPIIQNIGSYQSSPTGVEGYLKFDQTGQLLLNAHPNFGVELFKFDNNKGTIKKLFTLTGAGYYGVELNNSGHILYVSKRKTITSGELFQYDISTLDSTIANNSLTKIDDFEGMGGALQMSPLRNRIYMTKMNGNSAQKQYTFLSQITHPDSLGIKCGFKDSAMHLGQSAWLGLGLPNVSPSLIYKPYLRFYNRCTGDSMKISLNESQEFDSVVVLYDSFTFVLKKNGIPYKLHLDSAGRISFKLSVYSKGIAFKSIESTFIYEYPKVDLGNDTTLCEGQNLTLSAFQSNLNAKYKWQDGVQVPNYYVQYPGLYHVQVTNEICTVKDSISVYHVPNPNSTKRDTAICPYNEIYITLNGDSIIWFDGEQSKNRKFTEEGNYQYTAKVGSCTFNETIRVKHFDLPRVKLINDTIICSGDSLFLFNLQNHEKSNNLTTTWSNGSNQDTLRVVNEAKITLTISDSVCANTDSVKIGLHPISTRVIPRDTFYCDNKGVTITIGSIQTKAAEWFDKDTSKIKTIDFPGTFYVEHFDGQCWTVDSIRINSYHSPPNFKLSKQDSITFCQRDTLTFDANWQGSFIWYNGDSESQTIFVNESNNIWLTKYDSSNKCYTSDSVVINKIEWNDYFPSDTTLCFNGMLILAVDSQNNEKLLWSTGSTSKVGRISNTDSMISLDRNIGPCSVKDTMQVHRFEKIALFNQDSLICNKSQAFVNIRGKGFDQIAWSSGNRTGNTAIAIVDSFSPKLIVTAYQKERCSIQDTLHFRFKQVQPAELPTDTSACDKDSIVFLINGSYDSIKWNNNNSSRSITLSSSKDLQLQLFKSGCSYKQNISVRFTRSPHIPKTFTDTILCSEDDRYTIDLEDFEGDVLWEDGSSNRLRILNESSRYSLKMANQCGSDSATMSLDILSGCEIFVPNSFSPNNDGINDYFNYKTNLPENQITNFWIYNKHSTTLFQKSADQGWDGKSKGKPCQDDIYFYIIDYYTIVKGIKHRHRIEGSFLLLR